MGPSEEEDGDTCKDLSAAPQVKRGCCSSHMCVKRILRVKHHINKGDFSRWSKEEFKILSVQTIFRFIRSLTNHNSVTPTLDAAASSQVQRSCSLSRMCVKRIAQLKLYQ